MFAVVLVHPEIPPNTGNVIRLAANTGTELHLVEPLGFRMDDRELRRAGLDYHEYAQVSVHASFAACHAALERSHPRRWFAFTTRATRSAYDVAYAQGDVLTFGSESSGLPEDLISRRRAAAHSDAPARAQPQPVERRRRCSVRSVAPAELQVSGIR
jgi:tRNA (cytidine/uridine-2'-O-)-methyltransferase